MKALGVGIDTVRIPCILLLVFLCCSLMSVPGKAFSSNQSPARNNEEHILYFFWGEGCPHCAAAKPFLDRLAKKYPSLEIQSFEVFRDEENLDFMREMAASRGMAPKGVPTFIIGENIFEGFNENISQEIEAAVSAGITRKKPSRPMATPQPEHTPAESVSLPFFGKKKRSLAIITLFHDNHRWSRQLQSLCLFRPVRPAESSGSCAFAQTHVAGRRDLRTIFRVHLFSFHGYMAEPVLCHRPSCRSDLCCRISGIDHCTDKHQRLFLLQKRCFSQHFRSI
ncbi:MAG: thioredoxin family protein [Geobacteraceae bacterium]|nr:thioredoxin family protein [Geobacteraceae bacterium]